MVVRVSAAVQDGAVQERNKLERFEESIVPHLAAAYNFARWLTKDDRDAEDVVQEAYLRAFRFFGGFHGGDGRAWLLTIVRNTFYTWLQQNRSHEFAPLDDETQQVESDEPSPEASLISSADSKLLARALEELPMEFREAIVLRELEGLSYKEIADLIDIPLGTVMSRLARARKRLQQIIGGLMPREA
jgi:RNA polymerase sigma factor (sigma-70 family)